MRLLNRQTRLFDRKHFVGPPRRNRQWEGNKKGTKGVFWRRLMKKEYDFAKLQGRRNPYVKRLKKTSHHSHGSGHYRLFQADGRRDRNTLPEPDQSVSKGLRSVRSQGVCCVAPLEGVGEIKTQGSLQTPLAPLSVHPRHAARVQGGRAIGFRGGEPDHVLKDLSKDRGRLARCGPVCFKCGPS